MTTDNTYKNALWRFRMVAIFEGISFLVLLGIAMPLKYYAGIPAAVKIVGWLHGVLFMMYLVTLLQAVIIYRWSFLKALLAFIASLLPFGTFVLDHHLKKENESATI